MLKLVTNIRRASHTLETHIEANRYRRTEILAAIIDNQQAKGYYNGQGAASYAAKNISSQYKPLLLKQALQISAIGVGTYKGSLDQTDDLPMFNGLVDSLNSGCNVVDTCRNFRGGRSEIVVGKALRHLYRDYGYSRNNFFIGSKVGYVRDNLPSSLAMEAVNEHCVHPQFLKFQLQESLNRLGVSTIDVYYLNNFSEAQMQKIQKPIFEERLIKAFEFFQNARANNKIRFYGLSSWQSFRIAQGLKGHLNLENIVKIAEKVGGSQHGFRFVQLPINILMPEAFAEKYIGEHSFLDIAQQLKINVISNSPLLSGSLINVPMPANLLKCINNGAKHLQLIRSIPSKALVSTLIGQKLNRHVRKNLEVLSVPSLDQGEWLNVFVPSNEVKGPDLERQSL